MKKTLKKLIGILTCVGMCSSFSFTVAHATTYTSMSIARTGSVLLKSDTSDHYIEFDLLCDDGTTKTDADFEDLTGFTFTSSDTDVAAISTDGKIQMHDYGVTTLTASYQGVSGSMLLTVTPKIWVHDSFDTSTSSTTRTGAGAKSVAGVSDTTHLVQTDLTWQSLMLKEKSAEVYAQGFGLRSGSNEAWFYDNGQTTDSEAGVLFRTYRNYYATGALGVANASDTTYKLTGVTPYDKGDFKVTAAQVASAADTGIARTKGWHQVSDVCDIYSNNSYLYLDGKLVKTIGNAGYLTPGLICAYAGQNTSHTAYFDDVYMSQYVSLKNVALTENNDGSLSSTYSYNGTSDDPDYTSGNKTVSYKWYYGDRANSQTWTQITGADGSTYTPDSSVNGKYVKVGIQVTDNTETYFGNVVTYTTEEYYSSPIPIGEIAPDSISLGKNVSHYTKDTQTAQLTVTGFIDGVDAGANVSDLTGYTFTSSNTNAVTVSNSGLMTIKDYGTSVITASIGTKTAKIMITVTPQVWASDGFDTSAVSYIRTGAGAKTLNGIVSDTCLAQNIFFSSLYPSSGSTTLKTGYGRRSETLEAWFYDNGATSDSESGIAFRAYNNYYATGALGVINSSDTTYKLTGVTAYVSGTAEYKMTPAQVAAATDTKIARTKGWHQVTDVVKHNPAQSGTYSCELYLDGQYISTENSAWCTPGLINAYAGQNTSHTAYFDDAALCEYAALESVTVTKGSDNVLTAGYTYSGGTYALSGTPSYKWYYADSADASTWTEISGATNSTYTPDSTLEGKYIKAGVTVSDNITRADTTSYDKTITTAEHYSEPQFIVSNTSISYSNGAVTVLSSDAITNGVLFVAKYSTVNNFKTLTSVVKYDVNCSASSSSSISVGTLTPGTNETISLMLWNSTDTMKPLCSKVDVQ